MSFSHIVWQERIRIIRTFHHAIVHGMVDTWKRCSQYGSAPDEPDFVAGLVLESTPILYQALKALFQQHGLNFSLAAVFCHQTPKVHFTGIAKTSCEVGDLLIVHIHSTPAGAITRNALLYQAKMSAKQPYKLPNSEKDQLKLYTDWPQFEYFQSPPLSGQRRDVTPKLPHTGAQYLLIDDRSPSDPQSGLSGVANTYPIGSCMADQYLHDHNHLAGELFDFLLLRSGRAFVAQSSISSMDGWSQVVWDLLGTGLRKAFNRRKSGRSSASRHGGGPVHLLDGVSFAWATDISALTTAIQLFGVDGPEVLYSDTLETHHDEDWPQDNFYDPDSGISIILLETSEGSRE